MRRMMPFVLMITVFLCAFYIPNTASAHTQLMDSKPKQDEMLQEAPKSTGQEHQNVTNLLLLPT